MFFLGERCFIARLKLPSVDDMRAAVVAEVKTWKGTRFGHRQRVKNGEVDCAGLLAEVYERCEILPHIELPEYPKDWCHHATREIYKEMIEAVARESNQSLPGNMATFSFGAVEVAHVGIVIEWPIIIAAWPLSRKVVELDCDHTPAFIDRFYKFYDPFPRQLKLSG